MANRDSIILTPIQLAEPLFGKFDLPRVVCSSIERAGVSIQSEDIIVISSKFAAMSEGSFVRIADVSPSNQAKRLAKTYNMQPAFAELVLRESREILGGIPGYILAISKKARVLAPNAGIDRSNVPQGYAILYPNNPQRLARTLVRYFTSHFLGRGKGKSLGVILSDSRVTPTRIGTIGVAVAAAGFAAVIDLRGKRDLFQNKLKVTLKAQADQIASAAELLMGESNEAIPIVVVHGLPAEKQANRVYRTMTVDRSKCLFIKGLRNPPN